MICLCFHSLVFVALLTLLGRGFELEAWSAHFHTLAFMINYHYYRLTRETVFLFYRDTFIRDLGELWLSELEFFALFAVSVGTFSFLSWSFLNRAWAVFLALCVILCCL